MENQAILKRLQEKQSHYNVIKWEEQRLENERLLKNISQKPLWLYDGYQDHTRLTTADPTMSVAQNLPKIRRGGGSLPRKGRRNLRTQQNFYPSRQGLTGTRNDKYSSSQKQSQDINQDIGSLINLDPDRKILMKKGRMMSNGFYFIEVSSTENLFYIAAIKKRNYNETYLIELELEKSSQILSQFNITVNENDWQGDFNNLVDNLEILDGKLVLLNPKIKPQKIIRKRMKPRVSHSQPRIRSKKRRDIPPAIPDQPEDNFENFKASDGIFLLHYNIKSLDPQELGETQPHDLDQKEEDKEESKSQDEVCILT